MHSYPLIYVSRLGEVPWRESLPSNISLLFLPPFHSTLSVAIFSGNAFTEDLTGPLSTLLAFPNSGWEWDRGIDSKFKWGIMPSPCLIPAVKG